MYEEESDNETEEKESKYITEGTAEEIEEPKKEKKSHHRKEKTTFLSI